MQPEAPLEAQSDADQFKSTFEEQKVTEEEWLHPSGQPVRTPAPPPVPKELESYVSSEADDGVERRVSREEEGGIRRTIIEERRVIKEGDDKMAHISPVSTPPASPALEDSGARKTIIHERTVIVEEEEIEAPQPPVVHAVKQSTGLQPEVIHGSEAVEAPEAGMKKTIIEKTRVVIEEEEDEDEPLPVDAIQAGLLFGMRPNLKTHCFHAKHLIFSDPVCKFGLPIFLPV